MPPKTNESWVEEFKKHPFRRLADSRIHSEVLVEEVEVHDWLRTLLTAKDREKEEAVADIIKMSDQLELECGLDGDKGTKQWMSFKGFRNAIRDKYLR